MVVYKIFIIIFLILLSSVLIIESLILLEGSKTETKKVDYLIVLGARLYGETPSPSLLERLKVALKYLETNKSVKVVVSGGQGADEDIAEALAMSKYLIDKGIDEKMIIIEDKSTSTFENLSLSLDKIRQVDDSEDIEVLIATNKYHLFRSKMLANRLGMKAHGLPAKIPSTTIFTSYIREYFAVIKSFFYDKL